MIMIGDIILFMKKWWKRNVTCRLKKEKPWVECNNMMMFIE